MSKTNDVKKLFSKYSNVNFFQEFTLQDVEDAKKRCYFRMVQDGHDHDDLRRKLDHMGQTLIEEKFNPSTPSVLVGSIVKNTVKDNLNPNYKNTIRRIINLDSQYRPNLYPYLNSMDMPNPNTCATNYIAHLTEKLDNVVSIQIENIQIPYTMYNIEAAQGNNYFTITTTSTTYTITVADGNYKIGDLIDAINTNTDFSSNNLQILDLTADGKIVIENSGTDPITIVYYSSANDNEYTKYNNNLGWILGFRNITAFDDIVAINMEYIIPAKNTGVNGFIKSEAVACLYNTKYIIITVDEFNKNVTNGTIVQTKLGTATIKPTTYWNYQDKTKCLTGLTCENMSQYLNTPATQTVSRTNTCSPNDSVQVGRTLTRAQLYSQSQINNNRVAINQQELRLDCNTPANVLGILPVEPKVAWGEYFFTDKIDFKREYHGPIEIEKLHIQMFNDKGFPVNFNGADWYMTISTEHLYKY
jgi:hypothetical protein